MTVVRSYDGPDPGPPVRVVPREPQRHGGLLRVRGWEVAVADPVDQVTELSDLVAAAGALSWDAETPGDRPPFSAGLLGFLTDDLSLGLLDLPGDDARPAPAPLPPLWFGHYTHAACLAPDGRWWITGRTVADLDRADALLRAAARSDAGAGSGAGSSSSAGTIGAFPAHGAVGPRSRPRPPQEPSSAAWTSIDRWGHEQAVRRIQGWIADGDVYQVNLTLHVAAEWTRSPGALAAELFGASQGAPHAAYLHAPGATIASVSPETFLRMDGRHAQVRPIKGTRRRGGDAEADRRLAEDLQGASKDRAEHVMIVDLERNDLGRISRTGSVRVPELLALEAHPTVWHLTSTVTGHVRDDVDLGEVLAALFPCGSVTGAPKRMAVGRTRLVEPWRRGVYCGAIGVVTRGMVELSVAIRTAVVHDGRAVYGTGGGIVADSDPAEEWDEAMAKAAAFFAATRSSPPDLTP